MSRLHEFACPLPNGIHARPASAIEEVARRVAARVTLTNLRTGLSADAKSVLGIVGLDIRHEDPCRIEISGPDEADGLAVLSTFVDRDFPGCDAAIPVVPGRAPVTLPPLLRGEPACWFPGTPVVPGLGRGRVVTAGAFVVPAAIPRSGILPAHAGAECARVDAALAAVARDCQTRAEERPQAEEAGVLRAHAGVARDPELRRRLHHSIRVGGRTAAGAIEEAESHFTGMLLASESALVRERALDVRDVCRQTLKAVYGEAAGPDAIRLETDSVCVAETLTPGQFLALDRTKLQGLVLLGAGATSHTVILARSFGVPTIVDAPGLEVAGLEGREVVIDAHLGLVVTPVTEGARRYYEMERRRLDGRRDRLRAFAAQPAATADGRRIEVAANVGSADEAEAAFAAGAEGIGLFRTEMLFLDRDTPPGEEEQFRHYRRVVAAAAGRPVIIRTLDVGGDKPLPYLRLPREDNPFLGYRAVRLYPGFETVFRDQVRALVRASADGPLSVMIPMVSSVEEVRWVRTVVADEQSHCARAGIGFDPSMRLGAMIEVPAAAFLLDRLGTLLDFFSIGTNDLLQYFAAADRANAKVAHLYQPFSPAFVRMLQQIVNGAHAAGRWVGVCGELGGDLRALPLLIGLGLDEISLAAPGIPAVKAAMRELTSGACREAVARVTAAGGEEDVLAAVEGVSAGRPAPLLTPSLVVRGARCRNKAEAIKTAVDLLYVEGRTERPREVEDAVWAREEVYSTGFGHGFAVPHCKTDAVNAGTLAVVTLEDPVDWGALDGAPVGVLILLAVRASDQAASHMRVLAALARRLMHEDFRERIARETDAHALCRFIEESIGLDRRPG